MKFETIHGTTINTVEQDSTETPEQPQPAGIILERHHLAAAAFCGDEGRYQISQINVKPDGTVEATNGHYAIRVPASRYPGSDFPDVEGRGGPLSGPVMIPAETAKATEKALPKKSTIPILSCAYVGNGGGSAKIATTDLETPIVRTAPQSRSKFPDLDSVIPEVTDKSIRIGMNAEYLRDIAAYALKSGNGRAAVMVELIIPDPDLEQASDKPLMFHVRVPGDQKATVVLMPMRLK